MTDCWRHGFNKEDTYQWERFLIRSREDTHRICKFCGRSEKALWNGMFWRRISLIQFKCDLESVGINLEEFCGDR